MNNTISLLAALLLLTTACNMNLTAPVPDPPPPPPFVIGHWILETSATGEHLRIEVDGSFTEAGGSPFDVPQGTISEGESWSGPWTFVAPESLSLDDAQTGEHNFFVFLQGTELVLRTSSSRSYQFRPEATDGGAD